LCPLDEPHVIRWRIFRGVRLAGVQCVPERQLAVGAKREELHGFEQAKRAVGGVVQLEVELNHLFRQPTSGRTDRTPATADCVRHPLELIAIREHVRTTLAHDTSRAGVAVRRLNVIHDFDGGLCAGQMRFGRSQCPTVRGENAKRCPAPFTAGMARVDTADSVLTSPTYQ
jgi:hypothetical protein